MLHELRDRKPAIQQVGNLRYGKTDETGPSPGGGKMLVLFANFAIKAFSKVRL
jgi:hypothetical protein